MTHRALADRLAELSVSITQAANEFEQLAPGTARQLLEHAEAIQRLSTGAEENVRHDPLPPGQARVLAYVRQFILDHKMPPTRAQIARGLGFSSSNGAQEHLEALRAKGVIELIPGQSRGIRLVTSRSVLKLRERKHDVAG